MNNPKQSGESDAVLAGEHQAPENAILPDLEGVRLRLSDPNPEVRIASLSQALNYGEAGLDLVIQALENETTKVKWALFHNFYNKLCEENQGGKRFDDSFDDNDVFQCFCTLDASVASIKSLDVELDSEEIRTDQSTVKAWDFWKKEVIHSENENRDVVNYEFVILTTSGVSLLICSHHKRAYKTVVWDWHRENIIHSSHMKSFDLEYEWDHTHLYIPVLESVEISPGGKAMVINYSYISIDSGEKYEFREIISYFADYDYLYSYHITLEGHDLAKESWYLCYHSHTIGKTIASSNNVNSNILK
jgi:hypothetical protein